MTENLDPLSDCILRITDAQLKTLHALAYLESFDEWVKDVRLYSYRFSDIPIIAALKEKHMTFDALTQKGSMGFNSGAPKQPLTQNAPMPVEVSNISKPSAAPGLPIQRVNEIGARQPIGPIAED